MKCREIEQWLDFNESDPLSAPIPSPVQDHLKSCLRCRQMFRSQAALRQTIHALKTVPDLTRPEAFADQIMNAVARADASACHRVQNPVLRFLSRPVTRFALAGLLLVTGTSWLHQEVQVLNQVIVLEMKMNTSGSRTGISLNRLLHILGPASESLSGHSLPDLVRLTENDPNVFRIDHTRFSPVEMLKIARALSVFKKEYPREHSFVTITGNRHEIVVSYTGGK